MILYLKENISVVINAIGGFAGFLSAIYVFVGELRKKPKIEAKIKKAKFDIGAGRISYSFYADIVLGNVGEEGDALTSSELLLEYFDEKMDGYRRIHNQKKLIAEDKEVFAINLNPGNAKTVTLIFSKRGNENPLKDFSSVPGKLTLCFLNSKKQSFNVNFERKHNG